MLQACHIFLVFHSERTGTGWIPAGGNEKSDKIDCKIDLLVKRPERRRMKRGQEEMGRKERGGEGEWQQEEPKRKTRDKLE